MKEISAVFLFASTVSKNRSSIYEETCFGGFVDLLLCCAVMTFAVSCTSSFSYVRGEITLDESAEGVLGRFDIEVKVPKSPSGLTNGADDPEIIAAVKREIAKFGGTRAIDVIMDGRETFSNIIVRVTGTVVK